MIDWILYVLWTVNIEALIIPLSILLIVLLNIGLALHEHLRQFRCYPTFDEYLEQHPQARNKGRVACHNCGASHIQFRGVRNAGDRRRVHFCVTCGTPLYRSRH